MAGMITTPQYFWMEPGRPDPEEGLRARVADPVWFLTRQWQLGELQGEDVSSPVVVDVAPRHAPISYSRARPDLDPTVIPAEALLEAEPGDWWTLGRRVRLGRAVAGLLSPSQQAAFEFGTLAPPYERLAGEVDGRAVFISGVLAGNPVWGEVPSPETDRWSTSELDYSAAFEAGGMSLMAKNHDGGDVDWFTVDGDPSGVPLGPAPVDPPPARQVIPGHLDYPGAPNPRWWELEDRTVDIGGFAPDRSHLATMLLLDVALAHADDWFSFPVPPPPVPDVEPSSGVLVTLEGVTVRDSFGEVWSLTPPAASGPGAWSLFHTAGLAESQLLIWPVAVAPQTGWALDEVLVGVDEDANLAWAVELRADGVELLHDATTADAVVETTRTGSRDFLYLPSTTLPNHWHPYQRVRAGDPGPGFDVPAVPGAGDGRSGVWRQAVLADLTGPSPKPRPGPVSQLIGGPSGAGIGRGHELAADAIPSNGIRLRRRSMLARDTAGRPVLWVERSVSPVTGPPTSHLRFDVLAEAPKAAPP
jgi:hypothetical protein